MSIFTSKLKDLVGQEIVVVMVDNRAFRGKLVEHDDDTIVLNSVVEALPNNAAGWEEPTASTAIVHKVVTWQGVFSHDDARADVVRLKDVIIRAQHVLRVWEWSMRNVGKPDHVEMSDSNAPPRQGTRVSRRA